MRILRIAIIALGLLCCYAAFGQMVTVTGAKIQNSNGVKLSGVIKWQPVSATGPVSYVAPNGGQTVATAVSAPVTSGAFTIQLPDTGLTNPPDICFWVTFSSPKGDNFGDGTGYRCVQPHGTAVSTTDWCQAGICNFDNYVPPSDPTQANYGPPDMYTMWNSIVYQWLATPGNVVQKNTLNDLATITLNLNGSMLSASTLKLHSGNPPAPNGLYARTINVTGLVAGARFMVVIDTSPATVMQTVTFGTGCTWSFGPGVAVTNNTLSIGPWMNSSYLAYFMYDGTTCLGMVAN